MGKITITGTSSPVTPDTPGIDDVLQEGQSLAASRLINCNGHSFNINSSPQIQFRTDNFILTDAANTNDYLTIGTTGDMLLLGSLEASTTVKTGGYTVASLPAGSIGQMAYVTDADTPAYLTTVVGGGGITCPVFFDGTNWICH